MILVKTNHNRSKVKMAVECTTDEKEWFVRIDYPDTNIHRPSAIRLEFNCRQMAEHYFDNLQANLEAGEFLGIELVW